MDDTAPTNHVISLPQVDRFRGRTDIKRQARAAALAENDVVEDAPELTSSIIHACHDEGLIVIKAGLYDNVIRILAPLVIEDDLLIEGLDLLERNLSRA